MIPINRTERSNMKKYDTLILSWSRAITIGNDICIPYGIMSTAKLCEVSNKTYILVELTESVESLETKFLVENIIFN